MRWAATLTKGRDVIADQRTVSLADGPAGRVGEFIRDERVTYPEYHAALRYLIRLATGAVKHGGDRVEVPLYRAQCGACREQVSRGDGRCPRRMPRGDDELCHDVRAWVPALTREEVEQLYEVALEGVGPALPVL